jgi:hypothetical protein
VLPSNSERSWISDSFATQRNRRNPKSSPKKLLNENNYVGHPTKSPKVNRSGEYRPGESEFRAHGIGAVGSPTATTLENNGKFRLPYRAENGLCREVGGARGTAVEQSLSLKRFEPRPAAPK